MSQNRVNNSHYTIRQMINLTGVSEYTLRGWEGRYQAFKPKRNLTGRRLYSVEDIQKAQALRDLIKVGHRIGDIAKLKNEELLGLLGNVSSMETSETAPKPNKWVMDIFDLAQIFEWDLVEKKLSIRREQKDPLQFIAEDILSILGQLGNLVSIGQFNVGQEHILSSLLKSQLMLIQSQKSKSNQKSKIRLVITTPEGDHHDLGITIAAAIASTLGLKVLNLGPNTPAHDLCEVAVRYQASHILIGSTVSTKMGAKTSLEQYVHFMDQNLSKKVHFMFGGNNSQGLELHSGRQINVFSQIPSLIEYLQQT